MGYERFSIVRTHLWSQERTFLVIAGSAHSAFEDSLPSGLEVRLRYVRPPTRDEFHTMLAAEVRMVMVVILNNS